jgi:GT2 family glycosyltransferase
MPLTFQPTLRGTLRDRTNLYDPFTREFEQRARCRWDAPTPPGLGTGSVSVIIPAHDMAYSLPAALDALAAQHTAAAQVIVVDDGSADGTAAIAARHALRPVVVRLPAWRGRAAARNAGIAVATGQTLLFADADMLLPPHAVADVAARAHPRLVLLGFRHNIPYQPGPAGLPVVPAWPADLQADHRVNWRARAGRMIYTGITLDEPVEGRPLDKTDGLRRLGFARTYYDWDLPRMVVTALLACPRQAVLDIGGLSPRFSRDGWGCEDTYLGAALIGLGLMVVPLRQLVGYHINPPDEAGSWQAKLATWPDRVALYRQLLDEPPPHDAASQFLHQAAGLLSDCEVIR